jgi:luciferase family oxidoreductase group 1
MNGPPLRLSILDQSPVGEGTNGATALRASVELAQHAETWGYTRYWLAEHHFSPGFAGCAPEILAGAILAATSHLRVGTGGVLLPRYEPMKVAEIFATLAGLHPGRVDMGLGRAGGPSGDFSERVKQVATLLNPPSDVQRPWPVTAASADSVQQ